MKRITGILLLIGLVTVALTSLAKPAGKGKGMQMPPAVVAVTKAEGRTWQEQVHATGTLAADQGILVKSEVAGRVARIYFKSGQLIKQGEPLVELDQSILRAQLALYEANLHLSELQFKRYDDLYKKHFVSTSDYDNAVATLKANKAQVDQVKAQLDLTLIKAPFSGKLGLKQVDLGDYVAVGQTLVNLQDTNPMRVDFSIPETYLGKVAIGDTVIIHSNAYPNQTFQGKIYALEASVDQNTRTLAMRASVPNKDGKLVPGTFVDVTVLLGQSQQWVIIPQTALVSSLEGDYVYRAVDGQAVKTPVVVLKRDNQQAIIRSGLKAGEMVITDGQLKIPFDGAPIMTLPPHPPGTASQAPTAHK